MFPGEDSVGDRLVNQLLYKPQGYNAHEMPVSEYKTIYLPDGAHSFYKTIYGMLLFLYCCETSESAKQSLDV